MKAYRLQDGNFVEAEDPIGSTDEDLDVALYRAGYLRQISTSSETGTGAEVTVYVRDAAPCYYIDLMGSTHGIATVVADDFPSLITTLKELHPLLALIGLDQVNAIRIDNMLEREEAKRNG